MVAPAGTRHPKLGKTVKNQMVYYTDETPGVNKRMVAGYYLFLCLIGFAILLGPTGSGIPITLVSDRARDAHELATPNMENGASCLDGGCHNDEWTYFNGTAHSGYLIEYDPDSDTITVNGARNRTYAEFNATCAECHALNWNNATYPNTHDGFGADCLTCHETSSPYYSVNESVCASCHLHSGHGGLDGYVESAHANSLTDLRGSSHAGSSCMHCMSAEGFLDQSADLDPAGDFNPITCAACHSVHSANSTNPKQIRAVNATELCSICHVGDHHPTATVYSGGAHDLTGVVECTDCHGFRQGAHGTEMNHSFSVLPEDACGQSTECHEGHEDWAIAQLEEIQSAFHDLVLELETEATALQVIVDAYNATADADHTLANYVTDEIDAAVGIAHYYDYDGSAGFHDPMETFDAVNGAFRDLLDAKAYFYENMPDPTVSPTTTGGTTGTPAPVDMLIIVGGAAGGIVVGLLLGVLVGRRR